MGDTLFVSIVFFGFNKERKQKLKKKVKDFVLLLIFFILVILFIIIFILFLFFGLSYKKFLGKLDGGKYEF